MRNEKNQEFEIGEITYLNPQELTFSLHLPSLSGESQILQCLLFYIMLEPSDEGQGSLEKYQEVKTNSEKLQPTYQPVSGTQTSRSEDTTDQNQVDSRNLPLISDYYLDLQLPSPDIIPNLEQLTDPVEDFILTTTENLSETSSSNDEVSKAYDKSVQEESLLPILKQELRLKIQTRRLSEGQGEIVPEEKSAIVYEVMKLYYIAW